jgi:hypothetical protein
MEMMENSANSKMTSINWPQITRVAQIELDGNK